MSGAAWDPARDPARGLPRARRVTLAPGGAGLLDSYSCEGWEFDFIALDSNLLNSFPKSSNMLATRLQCSRSGLSRPRDRQKRDWGKPLRGLESGPGKPACTTVDCRQNQLSSFQVLSVISSAGEGRIRKTVSPHLSRDSSALRHVQDVSGSGLTLCHVPEKVGMDGQRQRGRASRHSPPNNTDQGPGHFCYESAIGFYAANALGTSLGTYFYLLSAMLAIMELTQNAHGFVPSQMITPAR